MEPAIVRAMRLAVDAHGHIALFATVDVPAAHSMDTDWYAVDRSGRVARFSSGEEGGVPVIACREAWDTLYGELVVARIAAAYRGGPLDEPAILAAARTAASDPVERQLVEQILAGDEPSRLVYSDWLEAHGRNREWSKRGVYDVGEYLRAIDPATLPVTWTGVIGFTSADDLALFETEHLHYAVESWQPVDPRIGMPHAISVVELYNFAFQDYWSAGAIAAAFVVDRVVSPASIGIYEYGCSFNGPYRRRSIPREPLTLDDLPEPLRGRIGVLVMLRVSFNATDEIDPELQYDCMHWQT